MLLLIGGGGRGAERLSFFAGEGGGRGVKPAVVVFLATVVSSLEGGEARLVLFFAEGAAMVAFFAGAAESSWLGPDLSATSVTFLSAGLAAALSLSTESPPPPPPPPLRIGRSESVVKFATACVAFLPSSPALRASFEPATGSS